VLDGNPSPPPRKGHNPQCSANVCCGQTAGWIKMPLGTEVGLGRGDIVLDGDPAAPLHKGAQPPNFRPMSVVAKRLDGSRCHLLDLGPGRIVLDGDPPSPKGAQQSPSFSPCLLWPNGRLSELLLSTCHLVQCKQHRSS